MLFDNGEYLNIEKLTDLEETKNKKGIYFIYNIKRKLMYIGKASNIRHRLRQHTKGYWNIDYDIVDNFVYFKYVIIEDSLNRELYETYYINELKPKLNKHKVFTYKSEYYNPKYNKERREVLEG